MEISTPKGLRLHIGIFGRRNVGKSSLLNAITRQQVSIVSEFAGTTTDPVEKPMELLPFGPIVFIDTAGIDDAGALGDMRVAKTKLAFDRTDLGVLVTDGEWGRYEEEILERLLSESAPVVVVFNKCDIRGPNTSIIEILKEKKVQFVQTVAKTGEGVPQFREALLEAVPADFIENPKILGDICGPGETAMLVVPIDKEAPKGRLILPQVQTIRDLLDSDAMCVVVKERELKAAMDQMKKPPKIVVTDSQAFLKVAADTPKGVLMTSFSILYSRFKGDLLLQALGAMEVDKLKTGDRILIAEACSHHPIGEDIGRVKIPRWLTQYVGGRLEFETVQGRDFPDDVSGYKLVIHCGACMWNRRSMLSRLLKCRRQGVPVTNYGLVIAYSLGIFARAMEPFPGILKSLKEERLNLPKPEIA